MPDRFLAVWCALLARACPLTRWAGRANQRQPASKRLIIAPAAHPRDGRTGKRSKHWTTFNEPTVAANCGWTLGNHPPGKLLHFKVRMVLWGRPARQPSDGAQQDAAGAASCCCRSTVRLPAVRGRMCCMSGAACAMELLLPNALRAAASSTQPGAATAQKSGEVLLNLLRSHAAAYRAIKAMPGAPRPRVARGCMRVGSRRKGCRPATPEQLLQSSGLFSADRRVSIQQGLRLCQEEPWAQRRLRGGRRRQGQGGHLPQRVVDRAQEQGPAVPAHQARAAGHARACCAATVPAWPDGCEAQGDGGVRQPAVGQRGGHDLPAHRRVPPLGAHQEGHALDGGRGPPAPRA